jgi:4-amino-4-deoxy-L-arabinose transferase-like glycosyltransferase
LSGALRRIQSAEFFPAPAAAFLVLIASVCLMHVTSARHYDFWWPDASRHALNGAFYLDLFRELPLDNPKQWAVNYYLQYPALTVLFYPPMFGVVEAIFFALLGVSHETAQLTVSFFYVASAWGVYCLIRLWRSSWQALATALVYIGLPETALWGRQVMLEVPAFAFLIWGGYGVSRYLQHRQPRHLYLTMAMVLGGAYTKQTTVFVAVAFLSILCWQSGLAILRNRSLLRAAVLFTLASLPLAVLTWRFGALNFAQASGTEGMRYRGTNWASWRYYLAVLPDQAGFVVLALGVLGLGLWLLRPQRPEQDVAGRLFLLWFCIGFVLFAVTSLKEQRYTVFLLLPIAFFAVEAVHRLIPQRWAGGLAVALGAAGVLSAAFRTEVPHVAGYKEAVDTVTKRAPAGSVILFAGSNDGSFIFGLRSRETRRDLSVLRADKLLLRFKVRPDILLEDLGKSEAELLDVVRRQGVSYVVHERGSWRGVKSMKMLEDVLATRQFQLVQTIRMHSNLEDAIQFLDIYQNLDTRPPTGEPLVLELPIIGATVTGTLGRAAR